MKCLVVLSLIVCYCHGFGLLGGYTHHGVDKEVTKAANFAFKSLPSEELSAESGQLTMTRVSDVETQVVSGINYKMKLLLTGANGEHKTCDVVVWSKPWMNFNHLTKYQCTDLQQAERLGAPVTGAPIDWHTNDEDVQKILELALVRINGMMNSMYSVKPLDKVEHVTKQTVAGWKYTFDVTVGETVCTKSEVTAGANLDSCAMKAENSMTPARFHVEGLYQDWMDPPYRLLDVSPGAKKPAKSNKGKDTTLRFKPKKAAKSRLTLKKKLYVSEGSNMMDMFKAFKRFHGKKYESRAEEKSRYLTFKKNMRKALKIQQTERAGGSAVYGATKFADLTESEFKKYVGYKWDLTANDGMEKAKIPRTGIPDSFDWRQHNAVTGVKNQGSCGSCWAFSTTGNIEGQWALKKGQLISLSEQELVDCDKKDQGCEGGLPSVAYKEIIRLGGLETEAKYKYKAEDEKCIFNKAYVKVTINSSVSISKNETEMAAWLANNGPISIGINANVMQFYFGGISHPWKIFCNPSELDHGVLIVGYGSKNGEPYWIVKNSWGPDWGEKGYYLVYRGGGVCGLNTMCTSAVVD